jgi:hypothetical protein
MNIHSFILRITFIAIGTCFLVQAEEAGDSTRGWRGESSEDWWNQRFKPKLYKEKQAKRVADWFESVKGYFVTPEKIKEFWMLTMLIPEPSSLSTDYRGIKAHNDSIRAQIQGGNLDFEAYDLADQINVARLRKVGRENEANELEASRLQRIADIEAQAADQYIASLRSREQELQDQIDAMRRQLYGSRKEKQIEEGAFKPSTGISRVKPDAYGLGVNSDQYGRRHTYKTSDGEDLSPIFQKDVKRDAYGLGVHSDPFGRAVYDSTQ